MRSNRKTDCLLLHQHTLGQRMVPSVSGFGYTIRRPNTIGFLAATFRSERRRKCSESDSLPALFSLSEQKVGSQKLLAPGTEPFACRRAFLRRCCTGVLQGGKCPSVREGLCAGPIGFGYLMVYHMLPHAKKLQRVTAPLRQPPVPGKQIFVEKSAKIRKMQENHGTKWFV